jgi:hypothetical protein
MKIIKLAIIIILAVYSYSLAELPFTISDSKIRQVVEFVDSKASRVLGMFTPMPASGGALCLNASGKISRCTSAVSAAGACTCP